jgi:arsenate reductase
MADLLFQGQKQAKSGTFGLKTRRFTLFKRDSNPKHNTRVNYFLGEQWEAFSAGTDPSGYVHPLAIRAMAELGIDIVAYRSKSTDKFRGTEFDLVVTVCDSAAVNCPVWLGKGKKVHIGFPDPAAAAGSGEEWLQVFRHVRDDICQTVLPRLERMEHNSELEQEEALSFQL